MAHRVGTACGRRDDPGTFERSACDRTHDAGPADWPKGRIDGEEDPRLVDARTGRCNVGMERIAHILGKRQECVATRLAIDPQECAVPIDVGEPQSNHITGAQRQSRQQQESRPIARARGCGGVAGLDRALDIFDGHVAWQGRQGPCGDARNPELGGDGAHAPMFDEVVAQNLRLEFVVNRHRARRAVPDASASSYRRAPPLSADELADRTRTEMAVHRGSAARCASSHGGRFGRHRRIRLAHHNLMTGEFSTARGASGTVMRHFVRARGFRGPSSPA